MLFGRGGLFEAFRLRRSTEKGFYTVASKDDSRKHDKHGKPDNDGHEAKSVKPDKPAKKADHKKKPVRADAPADDAERVTKKPGVGEADVTKPESSKRDAAPARSASSYNSHVHTHVKGADPVSGKKKRGRAREWAVAAVAAVAVVAVGAFAFLGFPGLHSEEGEGAPATELTVTDIQYNEAGELVNPVDWNEWINRNPDVYAWLTIPDTEVDYPLVQHPFVDDYYLTHNIDGESLIDGVPYTQKTYNSKDLTSDKVTVVYGHTFKNEDTMFSTLHNFEDQTFFDEHPTFVAYTPTQRLEYEVVSAFEYDDRHILQTQDISDPAVTAEFFAMVQDPDSQNEKVRQLDASLDPNSDHLLVLSTCTRPADDSKRYLVCAVLRDAQDTEEKEIDMSSSIIESEVIFDPDAEASAAE